MSSLSKILQKVDKSNIEWAIQVCDEQGFKLIAMDALDELERLTTVPRLEESGGDPKYLQLLDDMKKLHIVKNKGYSGDSSDRWANFRLSETFGISAFLGVMVRMSDKWIRITNLIKNPKNDKVGESIRDTLMDLASYALIAVCILDENKDK